MSAPRTEPVPALVRVAALDLRVLRALPFATVCVVLAAAGHALESGSPVPLGALLLGWVLTTVAAVTGARRERSMGAIVGGLAAGQAGLHVLFHAAQSLRPPPRPAGADGSGHAPDMGDMPGMAHMPGMLATGGGHSGAAVPHVAAGSTGAPHAVAAATHAAFWCHAPHLGLSPAMLVAHLAATVAAGWWLQRGEAAVWRLVRLTAGAVTATAHACAAPLHGLLALFAVLRCGVDGRSRARAVRFASADGQRRVPQSALLRHAVIRRGPPPVPAA
ncbi:hypothetical protein [Kitasatospora aureofaciens]|uniref:hypothetical protein n=1 Tax=Kitasatospora aureofaciens TaxID=1894 RepID=UPI00055D1B34